MYKLQSYSGQMLHLKGLRVSPVIKFLRKSPRSITAQYYLWGLSCDNLRREITYDGQNYKWGFEIDDCVQRHQWFKLDLDPSQLRTTDLSSQNGDPLAAPLSYAHSAEKLVTDYLTALRQHTERVLQYKLPEGALASTPIEYIVCQDAFYRLCDKPSNGS